MELCFIFLILCAEVGFDEEAAKSITDANGFISKENFMKFAKDTKLVDFGDRKDESPKKERSGRLTKEDLRL